MFQGVKKPWEFIFCFMGSKEMDMDEVA
jgi:hypothetical protein